MLIIPHWCTLILFYGIFCSQKGHETDCDRGENLQFVFKKARTVVVWVSGDQHFGVFAQDTKNISISWNGAAIKICLGSEHFTQLMTVLNKGIFPTLKILSSGSPTFRVTRTRRPPNRYSRATTGSDDLNTAGLSLLHLFNRNRCHSFTEATPSFPIMHQIPWCLILKPNFLLFTVASVPLTTSRSIH